MPPSSHTQIENQWDMHFVLLTIVALENQPWGVAHTHTHTQLNTKMCYCVLLHSFLIRICEYQSWKNKKAKKLTKITISGCN